MKIKYKNAFSLTEVLIVLVIVAVLFAAVTPIVTRRAKSDLVSMDSVWRFIDSDPERGSFFDTGVNTWASSLYVGVAGGNAVNDAKLVINTPNQSLQNHIQFRYSSDAATRGNGVNSGSIALRRRNIFFGSDFSSALNNGNIVNNTIAGLNVLGYNSNLNSGALKRTTIIGNYAANNSSLGAYTDGSMQNIFVGANAGASAAGLNNNSIGNIYIGESAGAGQNGTAGVTNNIAIGYKAMSHNTQGSRNVFIGAGVGNSFTTGYNNTIAGSLFTGTGYNNTIIGYGTYHKNANRYNMTAIGYGACNAISGGGTSRITCIGYNSGSSSNVDGSFPSETSGQHIYLGGPSSGFGGPSSGFGGRSPLEIHHNGTATTPPTVVLNSNLAIRGWLIVDPGSGLNRLNSRINDSGQICNEDFYSNDFMSKYKGYYCIGHTDNKFVGLSIGTSCSGGYEGLSGCANITSDERLKENIVLNNDGLEQVLNLVPYNYTYKSDKTKQPQVGVIAQDLQKVFPISVSKGDDGFLRIRWDEMFYGIINAIKTLGAKIETLASEILNLEKDTKTISNSQKSNHKKIAELNKRLNNIERRSNK